MNSGKYVFSQIVDFLKMTSFKKFVKRHKGDYRVRELTCHNQLLHLLCLASYPHANLYGTSACA